MLSTLTGRAALGLRFSPGAPDVRGADRTSLRGRTQQAESHFKRLPADADYTDPGAVVGAVSRSRRGRMMTGQARRWEPSIMGADPARTSGVPPPPVAFVPHSEAKAGV